MATMQQRQHRAKEYLESQGFHVASTTGSYIQMQHGRRRVLFWILPALKVGIGKT